MFLIYVILLVAVTDGAKMGKRCSVNNRQGIYTELNKCLNIWEGGDKASCRSSGSCGIVCCDEAAILMQEDQSEPIPALTTNKTGKKAWDKCIDYQKLVFPYRNNVRANLCPYSNADELILNTKNHIPKRHEFPHIVLQGYTNEKKELRWLSAGSLVSERFVLTAAHCAFSNGDPVTHVALNPNDRADIDASIVYKIKSIIKHPQYRAPMVYNDIALLELEEPVPLSHTVVPACLVGADPEELDVTATTWNTNDILRTGNTWLRKVHLTKHTAEECLNLYPENYRRGGYNDTTQNCYGDNTGTKDLCQDDGGAPIVVRHKSLSCIYSIVGVASYGRGCFRHSPGVYSRVEPYIDWIESVIWP